jgi:TPR repeat protein
MRQILRALFMGFAVILSLAAPAMADPEKDAQDAYAADQKGDFATAKKLYESAAAGGMPYAMYNLGIMYFEGKGVDRSYVNAMKWHKQAADKGYPQAQFAVGTMYEQAQGVKKDIAEAAKWYTMAADQGLTQAQSNLGVIYTTGDVNVPADPQKAYFWFSLASKEDASAAPRAARLKAKLTPEQLAQTDKMIKDWKPKVPKK